MFTNLIDNAIQYSPPGATVEIFSREVGDHVEVGIKDNGRGLDPKERNLLFTKFYRVSGTLAEGSKGTGLGLFICKSIVELHKGRIWAESRLGKGTKFFFTLPVAPKNLTPGVKIDFC